MAIAFSQNWGGALPDNATSGASVTSVTTGSLTTTSGNLLVVTVVVDQGVSVTISDSKSNTWTKAGATVPDSVNDIDTLVFYAKNITGGASHTITATNGVAAYITIAACEYSGADITSPFDLDHTATGTSTSLDSGSTATTHVASEALVGSGMENAVGSVTWTAGTGYTMRVDLGNPTFHLIAMEDKIVSVTGTYNATLTSSESDAWVARIATFKAAVSDTQEWMVPPISPQRWPVNVGY